MGRPLHKKYFGNRNIGTTSTTDNRIGGEGLASYGTIVAGTGSTTDQDAYVSSPNIPGGVTATIRAHYKALSFSTTANGTGYDVGNVLEVNTGTASTKARAPVASIVAVGVTLVAAGDHYNDGDILEFRTGQDTYVTLRVNTGIDPTDRPAESLTIISGGTRTTAKPTGTLSYQNSLGGTGITFTLDWGVFSFGTVSVPGDYTVFPSTGTDSVLVSVSPATGTGAKADITLGLLSVEVLTRGSGYTTPADAALLFDGSANGASAVAVLTTDSGNIGSLTNQENAIIIYANTSGGGTSALIGDIIKQSSARRYKVKTSAGIKVCKLGTTTTPAPFGAYIVATSASGATYYVTKLTAHKATLAGKTGDGALDGQQVQWTFGSPSGSIVQIENA